MSDTPKPQDAADGGCSPATFSAISDTERLDWLQDQKKTAWRVTHDEWEKTTEIRARHIKITVFDGWAVNERDEPKKDIRAAIDAAIHSQNDKDLARRATDSESI